MKVMLAGTVVAADAGAAKARDKAATVPEASISTRIRLICPSPPLARLLPLQPDSSETSPRILAGQQGDEPCLEPQG